MGRRRSQKTTPPPQDVFPRRESIDESMSKLQQRRKHKVPGAKHDTSPQRPQGTSESHPPTPAEEQVELTVPPSPENCSRGDDETTALSPNPEGRSLTSRGESDSDADLSEAERRPASHRRRAPPRLDLRSEVIEARSSSSGPGGRGRGGFDLPDFLPPPFNSWSLGQLAVLCDAEARGASAPGPRGPSERHLERLLQLERRQVQTRREESGKSGVLSGRRGSPAAASSRLSSPKSILHCQRAFPLAVLSSLAGHSALLAGCCARRSARSKSCCRPARVHARPSGPGPPTERGGPASPPERSRSESRTPSLRTPRPGSPGRTSSHLRRMQASGNIRSARGASVRAARGRLPAPGDGPDLRTGGLRRRVGSEKRQSGSECRGGGGGAEQRRRAEVGEQDVKPDAVAAIMDNLPGCKRKPVNGPIKVKQVDFFT